MKRQIVVALAFIVLWSWLASACALWYMHHLSHCARPWMFWRLIVAARHVPQLRKPLGIAFCLSTAFFVFITAAVLKTGKGLSPHGNARWANWWDIRKAGLFAHKGVLLGKHGARFLCAPGWEHLMCFAPSGSGKGVGIVIPNLLHWSDSAIVHDVKGENFRLTSGFRAAHGQRVYFFNPGDPTGRTHRYNPFQFVSDDPGLRIDDLQKIAHLLLTKHDFWENEARTLLVGLALHLLSQSTVPVTFGTILCTIRESNFFEYVHDLLTRQREQMHPVACMALNAYVQKAEKERSGVLSTLSSALELWANPLIDAATSASDFDLRTFKKHPTTLYVGVSPNNLHRLRPLLQILYQQATDILTEKEPDLRTEPYGVLMLMDEFASLGCMKQFEQASAYFRGYRVRFMMIIQDLPQLERHYERAGLYSFLGMSKVKVTFASGDSQTAELISKYLGTRGVPVYSRSQRVGFAFATTVSRSISEAARPLLLPQEILQLDSDDEVIMIEGHPPIRASKIRYFDEPAFASRLRAPIPIPAIEPVIRNMALTAPPPPRDFTEEEREALRRQYGIEAEPVA